MNQEDDTDIWRDEIEDLKEKAKAHLHFRDLVAFYGSSSIRLWETLEEDLSPLRVLNLGFGGSTYRNCNEHFEEVFADIRPVEIVLYAGDNDLGNGEHVEDILLQLQRLLKQIKSTLGPIPVHIISVKPSPTRLILRSEIEMLNESMEKMTKREDQLHFIDLYPDMLADNGSVRPELYLEDNLHLNKAGYRVWRRVLRDHFQL